MKRIISIFVFITLAVLADLKLTAGEKSHASCQLGALYECKDLNTSLTCQTYDKCIPQWKASAAQLLEPDSFPCQLCNMVVLDLKSMLESKVSQDDALEAVNKLCLQIPEQSFQEACQMMANMYLKTAMDMMAKDIQPNVVCRALRACRGSAYVPRNVTSVLRFHFQEQRRRRPPSVGGVRIYPGLEKLYMVPNDDCVDCKKFFTDLKARLVNNITEQQLEAIFDEAVCTAFPPSLSNLCRDCVHLYVQQLLVMLNEQLDPQKDCAIIGFCSGDHMDLLKDVVARLRSRYSTQHLPANFVATECAICKGIVSRARMLIDDPSAQLFVENMIKEEICARMPAVRVECGYYVQLYVPILLHLLTTEMDPMAICENVHACPDKQPVTTPLPTASPLVDLPRVLLQKQPIGSQGQLSSDTLGELSSCQICDVLLQAVRRRNPAPFVTKEAFVSALREICVLLPGNTGHRCDQFVDQYGREMAQSQRGGFSPRASCSVASCVATTTESGDLLFQPILPQSTPKPSSTNTLTCDVCKKLVEEAETYVRQNYTEEEIEKFLESWCSRVPESYRDMCNTMVKQYLPAIIDALIMEESPETVCRELDLCQQEVYNKLLGRRRCTWGPAYWCSSLLKAHRCQAVEHCQKNVWHAEKPSRKATTSNAP